MSFDWREYFRLAQELAGQIAGVSSQEARQRAAIGRAYYAAFGLARNRLRDRERHSVPPGGSAHKYVIERFKNDELPERHEIGQKLDRLRDRRIRADYHDVVVNLPDDSDKALSEADDIIRLLASL